LINNIKSLETDKHKLLDLVRLITRKQGKALGTEKAYCNWIKRYVIFHNKKHPSEMGTHHIKLFLIHLAEHERVSPSTQNSALNAISFLYREVLKIEIAGLEKIKRPGANRNLPEILNEQDIVLILMNLSGVSQLMLSMIYGSGMSVKECIRMRIEDVSFKRSQIFIRDSKGKGRWSLMPQSIQPLLTTHIEKVKKLHSSDLSAGHGLARHPMQENVTNPVLVDCWELQWLFPTKKMSKDPRSNNKLRHHVHQDMLSRQLLLVMVKTGINKVVNIKSFQGAFASHLLQQGYDVRTVQGLLGHSQMETTLQYDQLLKRVGVDIQSPLEELFKN
jgi:integron integrase